MEGFDGDYQRSRTKRQTGGVPSYFLAGEKPGFELLKNVFHRESPVCPCPVSVKKVRKGVEINSTEDILFCSFTIIFKYKIFSHESSLYSYL